MIDQTKNFILSNLPLLVSGLALLVSVSAWHKSRAIYDIEFWPVRGDTINKIRRRLSSGDWTILHFGEQIIGAKVFDDLLLGRIRQESLILRFLKLVQKRIQKLRRV